MASRRVSGSGVREGNIYVLGSARKNMRAVVENPQVIKDYLEVERKQRVLLGLFEQLKFTSVISRSFPSRTSQENGG